MKTEIQHAVYGQICYEESIWTGRRQMSFNGQPLVKVSKNLFRTQDGAISAEILGNYLSGEKLRIGTETVPLVPPLKWYEIVFSALIFLVILVWGNSAALCAIVPVIGGALGGAISGAMTVVNLFLVKQIKSPAVKILVSLAILAGTFLICFGIASAILAAVK